MVEVILGMPGPWGKDNYEEADHYTTKIGGLPDWPIPVQDLKPDFLECDACGRHLCLVSQVYAPISNGSLRIEERVIYIFGCAMPKCGSMPNSWRALRVQKSHEEECNTTFSQVASPTSSSKQASSTGSWWEKDLCADVSDEEEDDLELEELSKALSEAASLTSHSKKQNKNTQRDTFVKPSLSSRCAREINPHTPVLPCFYIYSQEELSSRKVSSDSSKKHALDSVEDEEPEVNNPHEEKWADEPYEYDTALDADRTYLKFKKRVDEFPGQCFRYSYGGMPLLPKGEKLAKSGGICKLCGASTHYELQLMSPLLYFLHDAPKKNSLKHSLENWNWMTLVVYTCSKSCSQPLDQEKFHTKGWMVAEETIIQVEDDAILSFGP